MLTLTLAESMVLRADSSTTAHIQQDSDSPDGTPAELSMSGFLRTPTKSMPGTVRSPLLTTGQCSAMILATGTYAAHILIDSANEDRLLRVAPRCSSQL
jgi:hypothetical protein